MTSSREDLLELAMNRLVDYDAVLLSLTAFVRLPLGKKHASQRDKSSDDPPRNKLDGVGHVARTASWRKRVLIVAHSRSASSRLRI